VAFFGRGLNKIKDPYTSIDFYAGYIDWIEGKELYTVNRKDFIKIISDFNKIAVEKIFEGKELQLPSGLGKIWIVKSRDNSPKKTEAVIDWEATNKAGKVIYYRNQHSNGYRYRIRWDNNTNTKHANKYYLVPCRAMKRALAKIIKAKENDYYQVI